MPHEGDESSVEDPDEPDEFVDIMDELESSEMLLGPVDVSIEGAELFMAALAGSSEMSEAPPLFDEPDEDDDEETRFCMVR
jgi:hypothetical protein